MTLKDDLKDQVKDNYLRYASYVILDRAIPHLVDGLKPVQRRILWTLFQIHDGKLHKVANVAGQTMALHPHGDAPIVDALVNLANKGFLLDRQGNFGNPHTGDPAAAARYIETRLTPLSLQTLFNPQLTAFSPSYDGRAKEPVILPAKIPLLLMQGAEGIAVGMATKIFPHNFIELLQAQIDLLEEKTIYLVPDFHSGGIMDASEYADGKGKVRLRAKIDTVDDKTLVIREICYGTTTESVIRTIDEAAKKGKLKIDGIHDYTAENIEIQITLPRGQYADSTLDALYAFTECEVSLNSQMIVIRDNMPWEGTVTEILQEHVERLKGYLKQELELERTELLEKIFLKTLEQLFIENRLYKKIEELTEYEKIHSTISKSLQPFHQQLLRIPTEDDRERLLSIPIRRISRFDIEKNQQDIAALQQRLAQVEKELKNIKQFTIRYLKDLLKTYEKHYPRRTRIKTIKEIDKRSISEKNVKVSYDPQTGFLGTKVSGSHVIECSNLDKLLILFKDGSYKAISIPDKLYVPPAAWIGPADKTTTVQIIYRDTETQFPYSKRFIIKQFILDKEYRYLENEHKLEFISSDPQAKVNVHLKAKGKQKAKIVAVDFAEVLVKGVTAKGVRIANQELTAVKLKPEAT